jgi:hypothetical protein
MLYGKYLFSNIFEDDAILPEYKGSTFRGVFGTALRKVVCALKKKNCKDCLLSNKCIFSFIFETPSREREPGEKKRISSPPHPYVIEPPENKKIHFQKGEPFDFSLIIFGNANEYLPYFIYSIDQMGKIGVGKQPDGGRARFCLKSVTLHKKIVYSSQDNKIRENHYPEDLTVEDFLGSEDEQVNFLEITLKTPLRLKFQNKLEATLPFHVLVRAMLRRISSLNNYYGKGEPSLDYRVW